MKFDRTGIIIYTINYAMCVEFYRDTLELRILFEAENLTCFEFGNSYLMVEMDDDFEGPALGIERVKTCLRMNVPNVKHLADQLMAKNVSVDYQEHSWGTVAKFVDPDGNLCALKDSEKFEAQIARFRIDK